MNRKMCWCIYVVIAIVLMCVFTIGEFANDVYDSHWFSGGDDGIPNWMNRIVDILKRK